MRISTINSGITVPAALAKTDKPYGEHNPISSNIFFADPTAVEYNGRLYVYGTNDSQQFEVTKGEKPNGYGSINTLVCYSTSDMVNWTYENTIKTSEICTWAHCSWAPSITSRVEADGKTHFYLYFCNSGNGVGVMTSTSPTGPWTDPKGSAVMHNGMLGDDPVCWCFDPGVCVDDNGTGWLSFGGGMPLHPEAHGETPMFTGNCRIFKLSEDMTSVDSEVVKVKVPYHFEANELNYINGRYVLTYCSNWVDRTEWSDEYPCDAPHKCSMCYAVSDDPLDGESWEYKGEYLLNPDQFGYPGSNNHSHLHKFGDKYYIIYQNVSLIENMGILAKHNDGYRSLNIDELTVDEATHTYADGRMTDAGVKQLKPLNPYELTNGTTSVYSAGVAYNEDFKACLKDGSVIALSCVDFGDGAAEISLNVCGKGTVEIRLDGENGEAAATVGFDTTELTEVFAPISASGKHDVYIVSGGEFLLDSWICR